MAAGTVLFRVTAGLDGLVEAAEERGGVFEDAGSGDSASGWLAGNVGATTSIVFEDSDDPIDDVEAVLGIIRQASAPYMAVTDSFAERSRGMRALGRIYLNVDGAAGAERMLSCPWEEGEPQIDERTLKNAGMEAEEASAVMEAFFPSSAAPKP